MNFLDSGAQLFTWTPVLLQFMILCLTAGSGSSYVKVLVLG